MVLMTALVVANAAIGAVGSYVLERAGESVVLTARRGLVSRLIRLRLSAVESAEPGDLMSRVTADTTLLRSVATQSLVSAITAVLTLASNRDHDVPDGPGAAGGDAGGARLRHDGGWDHRPADQPGGAAGTRVGGRHGGRAGANVRSVPHGEGFRAEHREADRVREAAWRAWVAGVRAAKWSSVAGITAGLAIQASFVAVLAVGGARVAIVTHSTGAGPGSLTHRV